MTDHLCVHGREIACLECVADAREERLARERGADSADPRAELASTQQRLWAAESSLSIRWALAREIEAALGISTGLTDDAALTAGVEAIRRLRAERDEARQWAEQHIKLTCAFCGTEYPAEGATASLLAAHVRVCDRHPMREAERERDEARAALRQIDFMLRIPAAEYVPAISDVFTVIDALLGKETP